MVGSPALICTDCLSELVDENLIGNQLTLVHQKIVVKKRHVEVVKVHYVQITYRPVGKKTMRTRMSQ